MIEFAGLSEPVLRLAAFLAVFGAMAVYELWSPRLDRAEMMGALKSKRWFANLSMVVLSSVALRIVFPAAAVGTALVVARRTSNASVALAAGLPVYWALSALGS